MAIREPSTTRQRPTAAAPPIAAAGAADHSRLRLRDANGSAERSVDGGWWPRTNDFATELPELLTAMDASGYPQVWAVTYNLDRWVRAPHYLRSGGRRVRMGGFHQPFDRAMVSLVDSSGWKHVDLVVIAPDTSPEIAERTLRLAGENDDLHRADEIVRLSANGGSAMAPMGATG
jgi:hypothetical protein